MKPYVIFTRSDGRVLKVDDQWLGVTGLDGIGSASIEVFTEKKAVGNGDVVTGKRVGSRLVTVSASARIHGKNSMIREEVSSFFHSNYTYDAEIHYDGSTKTAAECELKALKAPTENVHKNFKFTVSLLCPSGYLQGGGLNGQNINAVRGGFGFPYVSVVDVGFNAGVFLFSRQVQVLNNGAAPTDLRVVMTTRGDVVNPSIYKGDGDVYVRVLTTLEQGDVLEMDIANRRVRINGQNAITRVDRSSSFSGMQMGIGENTFGFAADDGDNLLDVSVYWAKQFETM